MCLLLWGSGFGQGQRIKTKPQAFKEYVKDLKTIFRISVPAGSFSGRKHGTLHSSSAFLPSDHLESRYKIEGVLKV